LHDNNKVEEQDGKTNDTEVKHKMRGEIQKEVTFSIDYHE
jgi:hypothetical protein